MSEQTGEPMSAKQWRAFFLSRPPAQQLVVAQQVLDNSTTAVACQTEGHVAAAPALADLIGVLERVLDDVALVLPLLDQTMLRDPAVTAAVHRLEETVHEVNANREGT